MARTLISLGANLGNVQETMQRARKELLNEFHDANLTFSRLYRTPPVGGPSGQGDFLNAIVAMESQLDVWNIWEGLKRIETLLGRIRFHRWEARRIDIDILLHDDVRIWTPHFKVPHPRMCMRSFMLIPATEVAGEWTEPVSGWTIQRLAENLSATLSIGVGTESTEVAEGLQKQLTLADSETNIDWLQLPSAECFDAYDGGGPLKLLIAAIATDDPETIQWEDGARAWAEALSMTHSSPPTKFQGPRYLLPANDTSWSAHEILAACEALTCTIEPVADFK